METVRRSTLSDSKSKARKNWRAGSKAAARPPASTAEAVPEPDGVPTHQSVLDFAPLPKVPASGPQAVAPPLPKTLKEWVAVEQNVEGKLPEYLLGVVGIFASELVRLPLRAL